MVGGSNLVAVIVILYSNPGKKFAIGISIEYLLILLPKSSCMRCTKNILALAVYQKPFYTLLCSSGKLSFN